jgi:hypothetical protein
MVRILIYASLLFGVCAYAFWRGRAEERWAAAVCLLASLISVALLGPVQLRYSGIEIGVLAVDMVTFAAFTWIALRSERFWPLWIAGIQLTTSMGHLLKAVDADLVPIAYAAALRLWSYPILIILAVGTWRSHKRERRSRRSVAAA